MRVVFQKQDDIWEPFGGSINIGLHERKLIRPSPIQRSRQGTGNGMKRLKGRKGRER
jgi:hypothetical protein